MSYITHEVYSVKCDHKGCDATLADYCYDSWDWDTDDTERSCQFYGWQTVAGETSTKHYCPDHYHAECCKCGATEIGPNDRLEEKGWADEWSLCPKCATN